MMTSGLDTGGLGIPARPKRQPLLRLLLVNLAIGLSLGLAIVGGLLAADAHGLRRLLLNDESGLIVLALFAFGFAVTFGSVLMGAAIMLLPRDKGDGGGHQGPGLLARNDWRPIKPVPVRITAPRRD